MKKLLIAVYVLAAISTAQSFYIIDTRTCRVAAPIEYVVVGAFWPGMTIVTGMMVLTGKTDAIRRSACK